MEARTTTAWRRPAFTPARMYDKGMGEAVANRTINRKITRPCDRAKLITIPRQDTTSLDDQVAAYCKSVGWKIPAIDGYTVLHGDDHTVELKLHVVAVVEIETWEDVADRVATGNAMLDPRDQRERRTSNQEGPSHFSREYSAMHHHLRQASILMSGRHLQHGDSGQINRNMEVFTNCSTSAMSSLLFYLLLNGSGVGRCYDDIMMQVDWRLMPTVVCTIDQTHGDVGSGEITALDTRSAKHMYAGKTIHIFKVPDSREGWAQGVEKVETMTFAGCYRNDVLILDFSDVRKRNSPIAGMQGRPASGPGPLMVAINNLAKLRDAGMEPWRSTMYADHYLAECVLVGGARRAARMATKYWKDKGIFGFITVKRPLEYLGKSGDEIKALLDDGFDPAGKGFLWSSNNSVMVDLEFWDAVKKVAAAVSDHTDALADKKVFHELIGRGYFTDTEVHAWKVFIAACEASYFDGTGEPGFITVERLTWNGEGTDALLDGEFAESQKMHLTTEGKQLARVLAQAWHRMQFKVITNPCGEIVLNLLGGYCVIADVVPFHAGFQNREEYRKWREEGNRFPSQEMKEAKLCHILQDWDHDAEDAFRVATRALIRTNLMDSLYAKEVTRTNRIGVGMTGLHEYAFARFGYGWHDLVDEAKSIDFWLMLSRFKRAVQDEALVYSKILGVTVPHTDTTMKPAGTTSKLFGLTEGAHLPSMREFLRWVQFRNDDPLVATYEAQGYPVRKLQSYSGTTIVGFPTVPTICTLGMDDKLVTAGEATPEEQYQWLRLLEKYWIVGVQEDGVTPLRDTGNQVSYTLKYLPGEVSFEHFMETLLHGQSSIRCCSVMPQSDTTSYEYQPEEPVTKARFEQIIAALQRSDEVKEDVGQEHVDHCAGGACPISWGENSAAT